MTTHESEASHLHEVHKGVIIFENDNDTVSSSSTVNLGLANSVLDDPKFRQEGYDGSLKWTEEEEKQVLRIIDRRLMPFMLLMSFVLNMDRTNFSNAVSDDLAANLGFTNDGVNTAVLANAIVFTFFTLPANPIAKLVGAHRLIPSLMTAWAIVTWSHNFNHFMAVRVLLAATEAGFVPACLGYMTGWYKADELATRFAIFWGIQSLASAISGLISFGVFQMSGVHGLEGWRWLFLIDGVFTHLIALIAYWYLPGRATQTRGWFSERQASIAVTRVIRDDISKKDQHAPITWSDLREALLDTKIWLHLTTTFTGIMIYTPTSIYLPTIIRSAGFDVAMANLLTMPAAIINLAFSVLIAWNSDRHGEVALHAILCTLWQTAGYAALWGLPAGTSRWNLFVAATFTSGAPTWHGMHTAYMAVNLSPAGKRALALGAIIGAANICSVPGSQIYQASDAPRYPRGNKICVVLGIVTILLFLSQRTRYDLTNRWRERKWVKMTDAEKISYLETTKDLGSNRLDYRFRV
ncbi:major facilitator superfamily domain-containing protein [Dichotomocladium elegans]|nr:major facilitator superfamily domain-containing protein [Dichotomocladium elegans]